MAQSIIDSHQGIRFKVEAIPHGQVFEGRFTILDGLGAGDAGEDDSYRPVMENRWATEKEAFSYATEAAHHAIEGIPPLA